MAAPLIRRIGGETIIHVHITTERVHMMGLLISEIQRTIPGGSGFHDHRI